MYIARSPLEEFMLMRMSRGVKSYNIILWLLSPQCGISHLPSTLSTPHSLIPDSLLSVSWIYTQRLIWRLFTPGSLVRNVCKNVVNFHHGNYLSSGLLRVACGVVRTLRGGHRRYRICLTASGSLLYSPWISKCRDKSNLCYRSGCGLCLAVPERPLPTDTVPTPHLQPGNQPGMHTLAKGGGNIIFHSSSHMPVWLARFRIWSSYTHFWWLLSGDGVAWGSSRLHCVLWRGICRFGTDRESCGIQAPGFIPSPSQTPSPAHAGRPCGPSHQDFTTGLLSEIF